MPIHRGMPILLTFLYPLVTRIAQDLRFITMQQRVRLAHIADVGGCSKNRMDQPRFGIYANVRFKPE